MVLLCLVKPVLTHLNIWYQSKKAKKSEKKKLRNCPLSNARWGGVWPFFFINVPAVQIGQTCQEFLEDLTQCTECSPEWQTEPKGDQLSPKSEHLLLKSIIHPQIVNILRAIGAVTPPQESDIPFAITSMLPIQANIIILAFHKTQLSPFTTIQYLWYFSQCVISGFEAVIFFVFN